MAEAVRERRSKTKVRKEEKHPKRKTKEKDKLHVISDDGDVHENEPNVLSECQESQDNREGGLDQTIQPNINISKDDECKVENTELDTGQSSNITTEQDPSSNDILPSANQFLNKQPKTSKISSENTITETKGEQDLSSKDDLDISSHSSQQDLHNPVNSDSSELKSKTQEETDVSESFHSAFSSVGEISDTSPARDELKAENRANPDNEKLKTENETAKQVDDQNSDLNTQAVSQECNVPSRLTEHRVSPDRGKLKTENETAEQVKDQNKNLNTQVVSQECNVPSGLTNTQTEIPQDVTRNLYPKLDLNLKQEKEIEVKQISQKRAKHQPLTLEQLHNLYYNPQLMENMQYIDRFIQNEIKKENHEFYEILSNYQRSRKSYVQAEEEIRALQQNYNQLQEQVWTTERSTITAKGTCGDGANCKTTHMYDTCVFSDSVFKNLKKALESIRHNIQNQLALHSYSAQLARLQVESYIHGLYLSSPVFRDIARNAPVQATEKHSRDVQHQILKLQECISVLFVFHRRPITDEEFESNIQAWTKKLVALLLRTASYEDHMFILNHVLRCPSGIGSWAANFVSVPMFMSSSEQSTFGCPLLDHVMTGLATVLMPIKARTDFICMMSQSITPDVQQKNNWILVDSDGEEDEDPKNAWMYLHENDLVAILQQFPMSEVFQHVLMLTQDVTGVLQYNIKRTRDSTFLKLIAFCTYLVNILSWGLQTYSMSRYKQLNKRIGRMIRQCVQYVSDHWENFEKHYKNLLPLDYILRIQVEYDQFFLRSTNSILTAQKLGSWQFMTDMPFATVSKATMWQLLWLLHQKHKQGFNLESLPTEEVCRKFISDDDSKMQLADIMQQLSVSEMIYLLTALSNMAQNRPAAELDFIQTVCLHLFEICYVINETREMCSKVGRELLVSLATAHPFVLSLLIQRTHENMEHIGVMALYLFKELPFHLWLPQESDFAVLREWLLNSELGEPKNQLAQMVLSNVNWDVDHERDRLFMPYDVHRQTAILLVEAYGKFVINKQLGYFFIEGMKQVALAVRQQQTNEQQFNNWSWEVASKLHLHQSTFPKADLGLARASGGPPDLSKDNSLLQITKGLKEKNVMACYAAIMISTVGHSDGLFLSEGLEYLQTLVEGHHYRPTLHILSCIAPIFYSMPQYLLDNHRFLSIIESLLAADDSMYKVAKIIWSHDFPGPVTEYFGCMTQKLLSDSSSQTDNNSTLSVIKFWIKVVTKINKWYQDKNCCYLIDLFVKSAFMCKVGLEAIKPEFQDTMQAHIREASQQGVVQSIVSWVASGVNCASVPSLLEKMASPETFCWLSFVILDIESKSEIQSKLWPSMCNELHSDHKMSPEQALKKSIIRLKLESAPGINSLNIYRWGHLAMNIPFDHPVLPIVWQRFFVLFLGRPTSSSSVQQRASVGERFYDNSKERKKIRKRLGEACDYHMDYKIDQTLDTTNKKEQSENTESNQLENLKFVPKKEFHLELSRLFQTMQLWIEEPTLHDAKLYLPALPPQYQSDKLLQLFQNQTAPWLEFMDMDRIVYEQAQMTSEWTTSLHGDKTKHIPPDRAVILSAKERILNRLKRHDSPLDPPPLQPDKALVPDVSVTLFEDKQAIMHLLNSDLNILKEYAKSFHVRISHHVAIDDDFCKLLPQLYYNKPSQVKVTIECKGIINPLHRCSNPAVVNVNIKEKTVDEIVQRQIDENRAEFKQKMIEGLNPPPQNVCVAAVHVENVITILVKLCRSCTDELRLSQYNDISCSLFFRLIEIMNVDVEFYPPSKQFFSSCIDLLGKEFIQKDASKTEHILQLSLDCPNMAGHLSPHFVPINCPHLYISMYERLVQILQAQNPNLVFMLLTKFEIADWLRTKVPGTLELKRFADVLGAALYSCGADPDDKHSMVFELYIRHLSALLQHQFPSNLNNVMNVVLQGTATQKIHVKAWEIIYSKCFPSSVTKDKMVNRENDPFNVLSIEQIKEILNWMGTFFLQVRISSADYANFGLYPKLKSYVPHIIQLQVDMILCLVQKIIPNLSDFNPSQTLDMLWTTAIEVFAPWIITLKTESQLLSPWIQTDVDNSKLVVEKFRSILDTFHQNFRSIIPPYQKDILNMTWMYFTGNLCNKDTPKHVTKVYVDELIQLPWQQFKPDFHVLESMAKLKESNCEESFELLSHIVSVVDWTEILQFYQQYHPGEGLSIFMGHLLLFLMQCHGESKHIEIPNIEQKMLQAEMYNWLPLTSDKFRHASNWFLQTCDPKCIQAERTSTLSLGLRLLKSASGFNVPSSGHWSAELSVKRQNYVHSIVQLICQCTYDTEVNMNTISTVLINLLTEIETVIGAVVDLRIQKEETLDLVKEVFSLLNNCNPDNRSVDVMTTTIYQWLQSSPSSILLLPSIQASSRCLASHKQIVQIVEECIQVYFKGGLDKSDGGGWDQVLAAIQIPDMNVEEFLDTALEEGSYLLLYGYIVLKLPLCQKLSDERDLTVQLLDWSDRARPTPETESRLILWWFKIMEMILRQIDFGLDQSSCINLLQRFVAILHQQGKERESGGILGAIGFGKHSPLTPQFRIIARALSAMILLQIDGDSVLRLNQEEELANTSQSRTDVGTLQSMKTSKQYQSFKSEIEIAVIFVTDRSNCLRHTQELLHNLSLAFYPDKEFLSVVHHQGN